LLRNGGPPEALLLFLNHVVHLPFGKGENTIIYVRNKPNPNPIPNPNPNADMIKSKI